MLPRVMALLVSIIGCGFAQSTCPAVNFQQARNINLRPSPNTHLDVVRQDDGSYTGFEVTDASPYRVIATTPHFEKQFGLCLPHQSPSIPTAAAPAANPSGAGSQLQVSTQLLSGNVFVGSLSSGGSAILFDIFDSSHNLLSENTFSYKTDAGAGFRADRFLALSLGDMNGDGYPDLVAVFDSNRILGSIEGGVWIFPGNSNGSFGSGTRLLLATNSLLQAAMSIAIADVNGDGKPDIAFGHPYGTNGALYGPLAIAFGKGDGTFTVVTGGLSGIQSLALGDLNQDGIPDLVAATASISGGTALSVVLGDRGGKFGQTPQTYVADFGLIKEGTAFVAIGDLNGDGIPDIATSGGTILFGDGKGAFPTRASYSSGASGSVMIGDVDGDSIPDLVYGNGNLTYLSGNAVNPTLTVLFG